MTTYVPPRFPANPLPVPPYNRFRPAGKVLTAEFINKSPLRAIRNPGCNTAAQKAGKRFEKKLLAKLKDLPLVRVAIAPWIQYQNELKLCFCQPDAILWLPNDAIVIVEAKLAHTADAYWQLRHLYEPVIRRMNPESKVYLLEITRSFDPAVRMPEEMVLFFDWKDYLWHLPVEPQKEIAVLQWKL